MADTRWNGEPCQARRVTAIVTDTGAFPLYWARHLVGTRRAVVEVTYGGQTFYLDDENGAGWNKVTHGGTPHWAHSSLTILPESISPRTADEAPSVEDQDDGPRVQCWHTEPDSPCDWNICRQPEQTSSDDPGPDSAEDQAAALVQDLGYRCILENHATRVHDAEAALVRVRQLHRQVFHLGAVLCSACSTIDSDSGTHKPVPYEDCDTIAAVNNTGPTAEEPAPCEKHPTAPVIGGLCGGCTQHPTDLQLPPVPRPQELTDDEAAARSCMRSLEEELRGLLSRDVRAELGLDLHWEPPTEPNQPANVFVQSGAHDWQPLGYTADVPLIGIDPGASEHATVVWPRQYGRRRVLEVELPNLEPAGFWDLFLAAQAARDHRVARLAKELGLPPAMASEQFDAVIRVLERAGAANGYGNLTIAQPVRPAIVPPTVRRRP